MKIPLRKPPAGARNVIIKDGRHVGVVVQVAHVGLQPAFEKDDPAVPSIGVSVEFPEGLLARTIRISQHVIGTSGCQKRTPPRTVRREVEDRKS